MIVAVDYNSSTIWPDMVCDAIYVSGNPFLQIPPWAPYPDLYTGRFHSKYEESLSTATDRVRYITGGEPFCHYIEYFIEKLYHATHCPIRIDTDGAYPFRLERLLQTSHIAHVGIRLWYPPTKYKLYRAFPPEAINKSLQIANDFPSSEVIIPYDPNHTTIETIQEALTWTDNVVVKLLSPTVERTGTVYNSSNSYSIANIAAELIPKIKGLAKPSQHIEVI